MPMSTDKKIEKWEKEGRDIFYVVSRIVEKIPLQERNKIRKLARLIDSNHKKRQRLIDALATKTGLIQGKPQHAVIRAHVYGFLDCLR